MWVRTQLKIGWGDLFAGAFAAILPPDRARAQAEAEGYFSGHGDTMAAYSVRSGLDLLVQALDLKPGDEVIFSALNVKGMVRIVREAGLVAVPVDLDIARMGPSLERLKTAITPRSKVFIAAHLFGGRLDLDPLFHHAKSLGITAVEDCAQAFNGKAYPGSVAADVSMFSFGPIKTSTALGGALIRVKDAGLRSRMRAIQASYPVQGNGKHLKRITQFMGLKVVTMPMVLGAIFWWMDRKKVKAAPKAAVAPVGEAAPQVYEDKLADRVRDVAPLKTKEGLRNQPSAAMLALMNRRLKAYDGEMIRIRMKKGELLRDRLNGAVVLPAQGNPHHDYWVFALLVNEPRKFIDALRREGFDASDLPRSQHIAAPDDRPALEPKIAAKAMKDLIVVPCYDDMPDQELIRMAEVIRKVAAEVPARTEV